MSESHVAIDPADLAVRGIRIGRYTLLRRLAVGGMAELFLAESRGVEGFAKVVVLKRILPQLSADTQFVRMFLHEAKLVAQLGHPNIAQVYDIGQSGENYFFTMEYVHGEDMRHLLNRAFRVGRGLPIDHAVSIGIGMAAGLHYAHEQVDDDGKLRGIVHRDVTPSNVMVTYGGHVKLLDFGVAKAERSGITTSRDHVKGSVAYMSPEQCLGNNIDRRSDVFGMGILLYEATTTSRLFKAEDDGAVMKQIEACKIPPPSTRQSGYPIELERIIMKALSRDRDRRHSTAQELQLDLEAFARQQGLVISTVALSSYMEQLFGAKIAAWHAAQKQGKSFGAHLTNTLVIQPSEIEFLDDDDVVEEPPSKPPTARFTAATPSEKAVAPKRKLRERGALIAIAAVGLVVGIGITVAYNKAGSSASASATSTAPAIPTPAPAPALEAPKLDDSAPVEPSRRAAAGSAAPPTTEPKPTASAPPRKKQPIKRPRPTPTPTPPSGALPWK